MAVYIQIKDSESGPVLTVEAEEAKSIIDSMIDNVLESDDKESYKFSAIEMTEQEFKSLPEFHGF